MDIEKKMYFATKAFILKDSKFLVMHKANIDEDIWELPGGKMEFGESPEETLHREIMEETGLAAKPIRILDTWNLVRDSYQVVGIIYLCDIEDGEVKLSEEHDDFKWIEINDTTVSEMHNVFKEKM